jgi:acyl carrier protein
MDRSAILSKVNELMRDVFDEDDLVATEEMTADDVEDWDSANHMRFMVAIEEAFHIELSGNEVNAPENIGEVIDLIASKLKS